MQTERIKVVMKVWCTIRCPILTIEYDFTFIKTQNWTPYFEWFSSGIFDGEQFPMKKGQFQRDRSKRWHFMSFVQCETWHSQYFYLSYKEVLLYAIIGTPFYVMLCSINILILRLPWLITSNMQKYDMKVLCLLLQA